MTSRTANPNATRVLFVAFETGRWGPARLPQPLAEAGLSVAVLCGADNGLAHSGCIERHFLLEDTQSSERFERRLAEVMTEWRPVLIVPADERTVVCLQTLARAAPRWLTPEHHDVVLRSLGRPELFDAALLKTDTLRLARKLGVRTPESRTVASEAEALSAGRDLGYPVHLKTSFSWAGNGVVACQNPRELEAAARGAFRKPRLAFVKRILKSWLHRDWYPTNSATDVQKTITGTLADFSAVALDGRLLAGFATTKVRFAWEGGPSTVVKICANAEMTEAARVMIEALGATGFICFDFILERGTDAAYLIECNPRPAQVGHLGGAVGVDLCQSLAAALAGKVEPAKLTVDAERTVGLFPQEWLRDPEAPARLGETLDVPKGDPTLLRFMLDRAPALAGKTIAEEPAPAAALRKRSIPLLIDAGL